MRRRRAIVGHVDEIRDGIVYGWAWKPDAPSSRVLVDVFVDGLFAGQTRAYILRRDLLEAGFGDGRYGFELPVGGGASDLSNLRAFGLFQGDRVELTAPAGRRDWSEVADLPDYLRATFAGLLASRAEARPQTQPASASAQPRWLRLVAPAEAGGVSAYVQHIAQWSGPELGSDPAEILCRYLVDHGRKRGKMRAPLSAADIAILNDRPAPDAPLSPTRAQIGLSRDDTRAGFQGAYAWALYESASLCVEDCLVAPEHRAALSAVSDDGGQWPLSEFMKRFLLEIWPQRASEADEEQRALVWLAVVLFALAAPHALLFAPPHVLERFMSQDAEGRSAFEAALTRVFGATGYTASRWRSDMQRTGFDVSRRAFSHLTPGGHRIWTAAHRPGTAKTVDVQLVGPFSRRLGISDSCRALAAALAKTGRTLRLCDYALDHPNARRDGDGLRLEPPGPARVTILHVNLEHAPTAIAYLPDVFTDTHLVVCPYLELPALAPRQQLALGLADEFWAASRHIATTLSPHADTHWLGTACRPLVSVGRAEARARGYGDLVSADDFVVLTAGDAFSGAKRKNPLGAIAAFQAAFGNEPKAKLLVKTHSRGKVGLPAEQEAWSLIMSAARSDPRIVVVDQIFSDERMAALIEGADCLLSLHRAEGFGYHMIEAMQLGTPVVATAWSGNLDFCTPQTAFLVDYALTPLQTGDYHGASPGQTWAEPDQASAVAALRAVRTDDTLRAAKTEAARALVARDFSIDALAARVDARLAELLKTVPIRA